MLVRPCSQRRRLVEEIYQEKSLCNTPGNLWRKKGIMDRKKERRWLASKESRLDGYLGDTFEMHVDR
jgi:hypothetical protein